MVMVMVVDIGGGGGGGGGSDYGCCNGDCDGYNSNINNI
jgi:hypothetical protein